MNIKTYSDSIIRFLKKRIELIVLPAVVMAVYGSTLLRGIGFSGDTTKFQFVGKVLGTAHEPGAPGYTMLNYFFVTLFPFGSCSLKANLLSALYATAAVVILFLLLQRMSMRRSIAFVTSLTFAFTYTVWSQSVIAEVYTLNLLFVALTLYFFIRWHQTLRRRDFFLGSLVYALSFGTHLTMITFLPALIYITWKTRKEYFWDVRIVACVLGIIAIGVAQYGYLFWRTYAHETTYLEISVSNLREMWHYASGGQFQDKLFNGGFNKIIFIRFPVMLRLAWIEYSILLPIACIGFFIHRDKSLNRFLLLSAACSFGFTCLDGIPDIYVYMIPVYFVLALMLGMCLEWMARRCPAKYGAILLLSLACIPCLFLCANYQRADQRTNVKPKEYIEQSLATVGKKSLIICPGYDFGEFFWYYIFAEHFGQDSIYALYSHDTILPPRESIEAYITNGTPFYLPMQRCYTPAGLTVYYCTGIATRSYDRSRNRYPVGLLSLSYVGDQSLERRIKDGFRFIPVGFGLFRIEKPLR